VREHGDSVKRIGFLSFGHWSDSYGSQVRTAADSLVQSLELAVAAEELGADGAYFRVHHFARQLASPFPLLAAIGRYHLWWSPAARDQPGISRAGDRRLAALRLRARRR
jgi:hypothetical protein